MAYRTSCAGCKNGDWVRAAAFVEGAPTDGVTPYIKLCRGCYEKADPSVHWEDLLWCAACPVLLDRMFAPCWKCDQPICSPQCVGSASHDGAYLCRNCLGWD
jgi:hypothetical protein